jgi:hypothetical protein
MIYVVPNIPEPLSRAICAELVRSLPLPADDSPEQRALRDERAITALAHYIPENAAEAELAADIVAAEFHAKDALRGAVHHAAADPAASERCRRQHALMMRTVHGGLRALLRMQAERQRLESALHPAAMVRAGYLHSGTLPPEPEPPPQPAVAPEPPAPAKPKYEDMTPAEQYAVIYPDRARAIRQNRGMPPGATFPPPGRRIVEDIATGNSPVFLDLDAKPLEGSATESATLSLSTSP